MKFQRQCMSCTGSIKKDKKILHYQKGVQIDWDFVESLVVQSQLSVQDRAKNYSLWGLFVKANPNIITKSYTNPPPPPQENLLLQFLSYCTVPAPGCSHQPDFLMVMLRVKPFVSQGVTSSCPASVPWIIQFQCPATLCCAQLWTALQ